MARMKSTGPLGLRLTSFAKLSQIYLGTWIRHRLGRCMAPDWDAQFETGIRFVRHQFTAAMRGRNMARGRLLFDSIQLETDDIYDVVTLPDEGLPGVWYAPPKPRSDVVILYLHGGGYAFHGGVSARFAAMLSHHTGVRLFAPEYRLTPEHTHPAQADDALAAWRHLAAQVPPSQIVVIGDSAGGHMALMLLQSLRTEGLAQPALCIGLCPWTDIGDRGDSMRDNDRYDLVQGWMAVAFGQWLDPQGDFGREALSPITHDYAGLAPLYLQAGGREVLRDMIIDFAHVQKDRGAEIMLDVWPDMPHDFQAYDSLTSSSTEALQRIRQAIDTRLNDQAALPVMDGVTVV